MQALQKAEHHNCLRQILHGIEKEGLRVTPDNRLSQTPHPKSVGATLTHPYITTDYSEALLEFITPTYQDIGSTLNFLEELHSFTLKQIDPTESLWGSSMPPILEGDDQIPIAWYGTSHRGKMKSVYRLGLAHRYGKAMQVIAGIHYNFSLPDTFWSLLHSLENSEDELIDWQSKGYFALIRNFRRYAWLLMYLFGASPAMDQCFLESQPHCALPLESIGDTTRIMSWATSLRMSDLGYTSNAQSSLNISYDNLTEYTKNLYLAIHTPYADYEKIGLKKEGEYRQLSTNLLQIENEYYSAIRPKRVARSGEKPITALRERGVEYVEIRCLDLNPLLPLGINAVQSRFLDIFLIYCALEESPTIENAESEAIARNFEKTVNEGRRPGLMLENHDQAISMTQWGLTLIDQMKPVAALLDSIHATDDFSVSLHQQRHTLNDSQRTPSAQVLQTLTKHNNSFIDMAQVLSSTHSDYFRAIPCNDSKMNYFSELASQSIRDQQAIEDADTVNFDSFLAQYFADETDR
ncbi:MAG: glutamate--cysteine ligase [Endozoicomonadaceae bacterium]|nr:glutamate--cysteine ligase [Endozoicomonadaceae bacterium]